MRPLSRNTLCLLCLLLALVVGVQAAVSTRHTADGGHCADCFPGPTPSEGPGCCAAEREAAPDCAVCCELSSPEALRHRLSKSHAAPALLPELLPVASPDLAQSGQASAPVIGPPRQADSSPPSLRAPPCES